MSRAREKISQILLASQTSQLADTVIAAAFSAGITEAVSQLRAIEGSLLGTMLVAVLISAVITLLSQRWWLAPALLGLPAIFAALIIWRLDEWHMVLSAFGEFLNWCRNWLVYGMPEASYPYWPFLLRAMILLPLAILFRILIRRVIYVPIYVALIAVIYTPLLIWYPDAFTSLLTALAGLIILLPRQFIRLVRKERPEEDALPRAPMQLLAIPAAVLCLLFAQVIVPVSTVNWRLPALVNQINDWQDLWQNRVGAVRSWQAFRIADLGFQPAGGRLGGPIELSDRLILKIRTDRPLLLKSISSAYYTGQSWLHQPGPMYRFASNLWWVYRQQTYDANLPAGGAGRDFLNRYRQPLSLEIESPFAVSTLFTAGKVLSVNFDGSLDNPPYFARNGDLFVFRSLPPFTTYTITADYLDRDQAGFDAAVLSLENALAGRKDPNWIAISDTYLQLPEQLPESIAKTARAAVDPEASPYSQALSLVQYFQNGFTYSQKPDMPPADVDFVAHFLQTREGYCVYFASAMAVMARTLGIPARYAEGFITQPADASGSSRILWEARGNTAHAWVELYFANIGWLTFDPTPGNPIVGPDDPPEPTKPAPTAGPSEPNPEATPTPAPEKPEKPAGDNKWLWLLLIMPLFVLGGHIVLLVLRRRHTALFDPDYIRKRLPDPADRLDLYYRDLLSQLGCLNIRPENGETLVRFAERADRFLRLGDLTLPDVLWPVSSWRYGNQLPDDSELMRLAELHRRVESRLRESMSRFSYFLHRILATHMIS